MKKHSRKLNILISTFLLALFLYLAFRNVNLSELAELLKSANYSYVFAGGLIGVVLGSVVRVFRWRILLEPVKRHVSFKNLFSSTMIGYMVNNLIPRSGEFVRPYLLGKSENIAKAAAFGTIVIERVLDTAMFLLMFGFSLIFFKSRIARAIPEIEFAVISLSGFIFLILAAIVFMMVKPDVSLRIIKTVEKIFPRKIREKIEDMFDSLVHSFEVLKRPDLWAMIAVYSFMLWLVYLSSTFISFYSFGIMVDGSIGFWEAVWNANLLLVLISVAMFVPSPGATGPYHYVVKVTLTAIFAVNEAKALGYATATHLMNFLIFLIIGLYYFVSSHYRASVILSASEESRG
jgi:uncharacterized protein (TIRG00374 family)